MADLRRTIEQPDGPPLHIWVQEVDGEAEMWACAASDHGPSCRLCQRVEDDVSFALIEHVAEGRAVCRAEPDGGLQFKLTVKGKAAAEDLIGTKPEAAQLWADLQAKGLGGGA